MKQKLAFFLLALGAAALVSAQGWGHQPKTEAVTVSGNLTVAQGTIAVKDGSTTYLVGGLARLAGFIDGLKEGARVTLEGTAISSPRDGNVQFLRPSKMTLNGKDYDLSSPAFERQERDFRPPHREPPRNAPQGQQGRDRHSPNSMGRNWY